MLLKLLKRHFKNAQGFTLAEVLITLGIIGVVAALTLPTLIQNHKKQTYVNQLKKVVNTIENAAQASVADEGVSSFQDTLLRCTLSDGYLCGSSWKDEYENAANRYLKILNISDTNNTTIPVYKYMDGSGNLSLSNYRIFKLNDGAIIYVGGGHSHFGVDVNGDKGPNIYGRDYFCLGLGNQGNIMDCSDAQTYPVGDSRQVRNTHHCEQQLNSVTEIGNCSYYKIVSDGWKMNY